MQHLGKDADGRQHSRLDLEEILNWITTKLDHVLSSQFIFGVKKKNDKTGTDIKI